MQGFWWDSISQRSTKKKIYEAGRIITNELREERKKLIGSRKDRKLKKYSEGFNEMFSFFLKSYREGLLTFGGEGVDVYFDINGPEGKETIRRYENGQYKNSPILTRHPNIVKGVILGKKSFGLHVKMWSEGIRDWCFTKEEILEDFQKKNILIPKQLLLDFDNWIQKKKQERYI